VYDLKIFLVFPAGNDPVSSYTKIEKIAESIQQLFEKTYFDQTTETWSGIALTSCDAICEDDLTVGKAKLLTQAPFEHMSLKAEP
jgi:hypothetical protein